ncbi:MFS transporter [Rhodococcus erythropolis]|nr:MFS transporter [Rhodococcus erythropolis]
MVSTIDAEVLTKAQRWSLVATVSTGLLLVALDNSILYTALPTLTRELGASSAQGLWIINAYPLVMVGLLLGAGTLGDRIGHRRMFLIGMSIFGVASIVAGFAPGPEVLIVGRILLAVGAAAMMPATLALIRIAFVDERERNVAIAVWGSVSVIGSALGPILGGVLLEYFWWGTVFLINVPVVALALVAGILVAPANETDASKRWDLLSSVQIMVALVGLVAAIEEVVKVNRSLVVMTVALIAFLAGSWAFARRQRRLQYPLLDFAIFRNPAFVSGLIAAGFAMFAIGGIQLVTAQRFQLVAGFTPFEAGLLVSALVLGTLPTVLLGGMILHKVGLQPLIGGGLAVGTVGVIAMIIGFHVNIGWLIFGLFVTGAGLGAAMAVASIAIIGNVPVERAGMASSLENVSYEFGNLTAVALLGSLIATVYTVTVQLPAEAPEQASQSLTGALEVAENDGSAGTDLVQAAFSAFDNAYVAVLVVAAGILGVGAGVTWRLLRRYGPGSASSSFSTH